MNAANPQPNPLENHPSLDLADRGLVERPWIKQLTTHVIAAELNLTFFAARKGKDSPEYQNALKEFATVWYLLKQNRSRDEFLKEVIQ